MVGRGCGSTAVRVIAVTLRAGRLRVRLMGRHAVGRIVRIGSAAGSNNPSSTAVTQAWRDTGLNICSCSNFRLIICAAAQALTAKRCPKLCGRGTCASSRLCRACASENTFRWGDADDHRGPVTPFRPNSKPERSSEATSEFGFSGEINGLEAMFGAFGGHSGLRPPPASFIRRDASHASGQVSFESEVRNVWRCTMRRTSIRTLDTPHKEYPRNGQRCRRRRPMG